MSSQGFFVGGGKPRHSKAITRPRQVVRGGEGPPDGSEVSFFKTMQSIRKAIQFSKISIFFLPKNFFFIRKISKNRTYLRGISEFFSNNYGKIFNFYDTYKSREIFGECYYLVEKFTVALQEFFRDGTPRPLEGYQAPHARGPWGKGSPDGSEVSFFKTIQSI